MHDTTSNQQVRLNILAGISALIVVHGLGRFAFTPLLPYLVHDQVINLRQGAFLATLNYLGYLIGAVMAVFLTHPRLLKKFLLLGLMVNMLSIAMPILIQGYTAFSWIRFLNGLSNGLVFVLAPALLLEWLVEHGKRHLSGLVYLGVSIGLILDSVLIDWLSNFFHGQMRWFPITLAALPPCLFSLYIFRYIQINPSQHQPQNSQKLFDAQTTPLLIAYAGAGLGYILPMTFLPALAHQVIIGHDFIVTNIWLITAVACLVCLPFWNWLGFHTNDRFALIISYLVQAVSVATVLLFPNSTGIVICAIFMGGSFMGTVVCSQRLAKIFQPHQGAKLFATLISIYAGTQLIGPYLSKIYMDHGGSLLHSFGFGLIALIWGLLWMLKVPKTQP